MDSIDDVLAELETQLRCCEEEMGRCGSDYIRLQELTDRQEQLKGQLNEKTERWIYLTELNEKIEGQ